jgi:hypothetical protein
MNAVSTFVDRLLFAATCVLGWIIFPLFIAVGAVALLIYALFAELVSTSAEAANPVLRKTLAERRKGDPVSGPLHP